MDHYSYLNQSFDPTTCPLSSPMDTIGSACQLTCTTGGYPDLSSSCSQIPPVGYGCYTNSMAATNPMTGTMSGMRTNSIVGQPPNGPSTMSISSRMSVAAAAVAANHMAAAAVANTGVRTHHHNEHMQSSMFQTGIGLQSNYHHVFFYNFLCLSKIIINLHTHIYRFPL